MNNTLTPDEARDQVVQATRLCWKMAEKLKHLNPKPTSEELFVLKKLLRELEEASQSVVDLLDAHDLRYP